MPQTIDYQEYLKSERWAILSEETKRLACYRCQVCYSDGELHAHHRTYQRIGNELQSDLICLCSSCHALFHGKSDVQAERGSWALVESLSSELRELRTRPAAPLTALESHWEAMETIWNS